ncbi:MAG: DegV family protein [Lachnospiraceae bacterium]|nr:DegV family protein [Lachnospiraceae bacterium]
MSNIAIVTDTTSGITIQEGKDNGIYVLPMPIIIDNKEYLDGIDLTHDEFYEFLTSGADIHTSQPAAGSVLDLWNEVLASHDEIVYIPLSSGLSGSCASAQLFSEEDDFAGKVHVVNNQRVSVTLRQSVFDAKALAAQGKSGAEIKKILEDTKFESSIYIMLDTLDYLKKGGRITPAAAAFAKILNLKPILQIHGEKLDAFSKCRGIKQAKKIMINAIREDMEEKIGGLDMASPNYHLEIAHTENQEAAEALKEELLAEFPGFDVHIDPLALQIACHIGPGSLAVACTKKIVND